MSSVIVENIYYSIEQANRTPLISLKAGYIINALSMFAALVQREGDNLNYPMTLAEVWGGKFKEVKLEDKAELAKFINRGIWRIQKLFIENGEEIGAHDLRVTGDDAASRDAMLAERFLSIIEDEKARLVKLLILARYDQVSLARLEEKREEKTRLTRLQ